MDQHGSGHAFSKTTAQPAATGKIRYHFSVSKTLEECKKMKKRITSLLLVLIMLLGMIPGTALATEKDTVYISISDDAQFVTAPDGTPMGFYAVTLDELTSVNLDDYGLSDYAYDADSDGTPDIAALHLYIYIHEVILGLDWSTVTITGDPGSTYFQNGLFGYNDENLRYDYNGAYPAVDGWGLTADRIVLSDGDFLNIAHYTSWAFWGDSVTGFHYFTDAEGDLQHTYEIASGDTVTLGLVRSYSDWTNNGAPAFAPEAGYTIYYGKTYGDMEGDTTSADDGFFEITFPSAGTWYVWAGGGCGMENPDDIVSAPALATVVVESASNPDQDAADAVVEKINAINEVTLDSETVINEARAAYDKLSDTQKELVSNYGVLTVAEQKLQQLKEEAAQAAADQAAANAVIAQISAIDTVTLDSETSIHEARAAYDKLSDVQKELVSNYNVLTAAEQKLQQLKDDKAAADKVVLEISQIGEVTLESEEAIEAAWLAFNSLTPAQQALVTNYETLVKAQATLSQLKDDAAQAAADQAAANAVITKINAIGTVTLDREESITDARNSYKNLSDAQKALVTNYSTLTTAESTLDTLKADMAAATTVIEKIAAIGSVTLDSEESITAVRKAYEELTDNRKAMVSNYAILTAAEEKLQQLKDEAVKAAEDQKAADAAEEVIAAIGKVNIFSGTKVDTARAAFNALTDAQKKLVKNSSVLIDAENALKVLYAEATKADHKAIFDTTGKYIAALGTPDVGSTGGEWMVIDLVRAGYPCPDGYYENVVKYVEAKINDKEQLHRAKGTDNSRVILALTAAGYDVTNVAGHNLLMGLTDMPYVRNQGINGPIWALIAFDSHNYEIPTNPNATEQVTRETLITYILNHQLSDGGWSLSGKTADADMTGMAIQSLAPYYDENSKVKAAVDKALECLSVKQSAAGTFGSIDGTSVESCSQVVVALTALGIDPETDTRFVKNGISALDALCLFAIKDGGFAHVPYGEINGMATEQGQYALAAYFRFKNGQSSLYDMSDVVIRSNNTGSGVVENITDSNNNALSGTLTITEDNAAEALLNKEEKELISNGVTVQVALDVKDISKTVSEEDKGLVEKASEKNTVGLFLDITLTKQLGSSSPVKITKTNDEITISITVPEALRSNDAKTERVYKVIRVHEGKTDVLDTVYDAKTGKLSFQTDAFSTYALVYSDAPVKTVSPQTGDQATPVLFVSMMVISCCGMAVLITKSKKKFF